MKLQKSKITNKQIIVFDTTEEILQYVGQPNHKILFAECAHSGNCRGICSPECSSFKQKEK